MSSSARVGEFIRSNLVGRGLGSDPEWQRHRRRHLRLYICYKPNAGVLTSVGGGMFGLTSAANERKPYAISGLVQGLGAGTYQFGVCGQSTSSNRNNNEYVYNTALAFK